MKRLVPIMVAALALAACGSPAPDRSASAGNDQHANVAADQPIFQLPVLPGRPGAAYFAIQVPADHGALIGVSSPQAAYIEMHETIRDGSVSRMQRVLRILPVNDRIVFEPGARHLMVYEVSPALAAGGRAELVLRFEGGQVRMLDARVVAPGGAHEGR